jgi:hypothetical protein
MRQCRTGLPLRGKIGLACLKNQIIAAHDELAEA